MEETIRSIVHPWECDAVEHFTTAYYFRAYSAAQWHLMQLLGLSEDGMAAVRPVTCLTGFSRELRAGDAYHIDSGVVEQEADRLVIGHRLFDSETGELASTHLQSFEGTAPSAGPELRLEWGQERAGPETEFDRLSVWSLTSQCVVHSQDLDHTGRLDLSPLIHHTSDANVQFQNRIGMTSSYMLDKRIGFATFGYEIRIHELPRRPGTVMKTDTALAKLGRSSLSFAHRVTDKRTGALFADVMQMGVHFDRVGRKSAPIPDHIRESAERFLARDR